MKARDQLIAIDAGFSKAYQKKTGIAGYTLVYNAWGLLLANHHGQATGPAADREIHDIEWTTESSINGITASGLKIRIRAKKIERRIEALTALHKAYQYGSIVPEKYSSAYR